MQFLDKSIVFKTTKKHSKASKNVSFGFLPPSLQLRLTPSLPLAVIVNLVDRSLPEFHPPSLKIMQLSIDLQNYQHSLGVRHSFTRTFLAHISSRRGCLSSVALYCFMQLYHSVPVKLHKCLANVPAHSKGHNVCYHNQ